MTAISEVLQEAIDSLRRRGPDAAVHAVIAEVERLRADALRTARMDEESVNTIQELQAKVERIEGELLTAYMAGQESVQQANAALAKALIEARRWIGDGDLSDGLQRDIWTPQYRAAIDLIDAAIEGQPHD